MLTLSVDIDWAHDAVIADLLDPFQGQGVLQIEEVIMEDGSQHPAANR
jgi:hypothetical protein